MLSRFPIGEANALIMLLTPDLGLVPARAQGVRRSGAKLAAALATFAESELVLIRGKEGWRIAGALLEENWFTRLRPEASHLRAARVCHLLLRLVAGETQDAKLFPLMKEFLTALAMLPEEMHEAAEVLVALRMLAALGLDAGEIPRAPDAFSPELLAQVSKNRVTYITRINEGISASGL